MTILTNLRAGVIGLVLALCPATVASASEPAPSRVVGTVRPSLIKSSPIKLIALSANTLSDLAPSAPLRILTFRLLARAEAEKASMPFDLVDAVMKIESDYHPEVIGGVGEIGLMQVRPATAAMIGFVGTPSDLADPAVNIHYGTTYLGQAWHLSNGDVCRTLMKYRAGHGAELMSSLSATYCTRARDYLASINSPLALSMPRQIVADFASDSRPAAARVDRRESGARGAFWTTFEARIKRINATMDAKWRRMEARPARMPPLPRRADRQQADRG